MTMRGEIGKCPWCALPKARKGLAIGLVGSFLLHAALLSGVAYLGGSVAEAKIKKEQRVIYLGEFVIKARKPNKAVSQSKEI